MTQGPDHHGVCLRCPELPGRCCWTSSFSLDRCQVLGEGPGHQDDFMDSVCISILIHILMNCAKQMW